MAIKILASAPIFNNPDRRQLPPIKPPRLHLDDLAATEITCNLKGGYRLGYHPDLQSWLVIDPAGYVHIGGDGGRAFRTTGDVFRFIGGRS